MEREHKEAFALALDDMACAFGIECPVQRKRVYWKHCQRLSYEAFRVACETAIETQHSFPTVTVLLKSADEYTQQLYARLQADVKSATPRTPEVRLSEDEARAFIHDIYATLDKGASAVPPQYRTMPSLRTVLEGAGSAQRPEDPADRARALAQCQQLLQEQA